MGSAQAIRTCFAKSFQFSGRASRQEFWWFALFWVLAPEIAAFVTAFPSVYMFGLKLSHDAVDLPSSNFVWSIPAAFAVWVLCSMPGGSVTVRRLHDINLGAWWLSLVPVTFVLLILALASIGLNFLAWTDAEFADVGKGIGANWRYFLMLTSLPLLALLARHSTPGPNSYGPNPLEVIK